MKKKKSKRKKGLGQKSGSSKVKSYYLAEIGYKKGDGISDDWKVRFGPEVPGER